MYRKVRCFLVVGVVSLCLLFLPVAKAFSPVYKQVMETLQNLKPGETIELKMGTVKEPNMNGYLEYAIDEPFEMRFQASQDCYVMLMDISSAQLEESGDIIFLLPNLQFPEVKIEAEQVYSTLHHFSMDIKVAPPNGYETLNLFCSKEKINLFEADFEKGSFYRITPDDEDRLKDLLNRLDQLNQSEWVGRSLTLKIGPGLQRGLPKGGLPSGLPTGTAGVWFPPIGSTGTTGKTDTTDTP